jgi:hypothetical protein
MAAIANLVINDGAATPVAHTFAPAKTSADYALFEDRVGGVYVGYNKLSVSLTRPKGPSKDGVNRNLKVNVHVELPTLEVVSTIDIGYQRPPSVAYRCVAELTFTLPERCALQNRKDILALVKNALSNAQVVSAVQDYELPY